MPYNRVCKVCRRPVEEVALFRITSRGADFPEWKCKDCLEQRPLTDKSQEENLLDAVEAGDNCGIGKSRTK